MKESALFCISGQMRKCVVRVVNEALGFGHQIASVYVCHFNLYFLLGFSMGCALHGTWLKAWHGIYEAMCKICCPLCSTFVRWWRLLECSGFLHRHTDIRTLFFLTRTRCTHSTQVRLAFGWSWQGCF
jgi:hypothetical protein